MTDFSAAVVKLLDRMWPILASPGHERCMYDFMQSLFLEMGFKNTGLKIVKEKYQIHKMVIHNSDNSWYIRNTPNLGMTFSGDPNKPHLLFNAHLDHYFSTDVVSGVSIDGDWLSGDGKRILGADCKAGLALIYVIVKKILSGENPPSIDIVFDTCEEAGLIGIMEFVKEKQYQVMPFWKSYRSGKKVYAYCFDGLYDSEFGTSPIAYINRQSAIFLSKHFMNMDSSSVCDLVSDKIKWRKFSKKENLLLDLLKSVGLLDHQKIRVEKYGSSLIILSKIIPTIMFPVGFVDCHTPKERLYLPYLEVIGKLFGY